MNYFLTIILKSTFVAIFGAVKRIAAIAFIFLISSQCIFKLGIITYFQANRDYIAEVLCVNKENPITMCYGKCFLDRNLSLVDDDIANQVPGSIKVKVETSFFVADYFSFTPTIDSFDLENTSPQQSLYQFDSQDPFFHPPC